jgi:ATP-binding cassette subfamily E protein 1
MGENGTGKTTFLQMLAGNFDKAKGDKADAKAGYPSAQEEYDSLPISLLGMGITMSYKRQDYAPKYRRYTKTVRELLERNLQIAFTDTLFKLFVMRPLRIEELMDLNVNTLSGGELQRLAITVCLGTPAFVYLIDEPSAGLDCEQRGIVAKVIKRWLINHLGRTCFVIEHDCLMMSAMADKMVLFSGQPGVEATVGSPTSVADGFNSFLETLDVTFRRDPANHRRRINKENSVKDRSQKSSGKFYLLDDNDDDSD